MGRIPNISNSIPLEIQKSNYYTFIIDICPYPLIISFLVIGTYFLSCLIFRRNFALITKKQIENYAIIVVVDIMVLLIVGGTLVG